MTFRIASENRGAVELPPNGIGVRSAWNGDPVASLRSPSLGSTVLRVKKRETIFAEGGPADSVFYLLKGTVKLTAVSTEGREATITLVQSGEFFGEESLDLNERLRRTSALALSECTVLKAERKAMAEVLGRDQQLLGFFLSFLIARNVRMQEDLLHRLFYSSSQRLARVLLLLAGLDRSDQNEVEIPKVSQEILAEITGTTRSRVSLFMNDFRRQGLIDYDGNYTGRIRVRRALERVLTQP